MSMRERESLLFLRLTRYVYCYWGDRLFSQGLGLMETKPGSTAQVPVSSCLFK